MTHSTQDASGRARQPYSTQLRKGVLALAVLHVLGERERYAKEIKVALGAAGLAVTSGTLYPALGRLSRDGLLESRLVETPNGPARRYYRTTRLGRAELAKLTRAWHELAQAVDTLCGGELPARAADADCA